MALAGSVVHPQHCARVRPAEFEAEVIKEKKSSYQSPSSPPTAESKRISANSTAMRPSWLLSTIADLDDRMKEMEILNSEEANPQDTFAQRAESYYRKRPQLLSLLQDLYNAYLSLSDRYLQRISKRNRTDWTNQSPQLSVHDFSDQEDGELDFEVQSSLSYQNPLLSPSSHMKVSPDMLMAELVMKNVEHYLLLDEVSLVERRRGESSRKIELQENLLEVLESERMILQSQNAALRYQVTALMEENQVLASESELMKARAEELAKCVWKIRQEGCVGELSSQIDDLQDRIFGLEKKNKEYYNEIVSREMQIKGKEDKNGGESTFIGCFEFQKWKPKRERDSKGKVIEDHKKVDARTRKGSTLWAKLKMHIFKRGIRPTAS